MNVGIVTRNPNSYSSSMLMEAMRKRSIPHLAFAFPRLVARVNRLPNFSVGKTQEMNLDALIVRPIGRGSLEQTVFRLDTLYRLQRSGVSVINSPEAIEHCVDKYDVVALLEEHGLPVPETVATESVAGGLRAFDDLGRDVVVKPLFGSRGIGATRINDKETASVVFRTIVFNHGVLYIQRYVPHGTSDIRAFVIGDRVAASMRRVASGWKANYSQGARPRSITLDKTLEDMAVEAARSVECQIGGVDIVESPAGPFLVEVNSQPGWKGLQSVSTINIADEIVAFVLSELKK